MDRSRAEPVSFLLGIPRSGTTLLSTMLDRHPDIAVPPEPWLMLALDQFGRVPFRHPANAGVLARAIDDLLPDGHRTAALAALANAAYREIATARGKAHLLDKTPRYHHVLPLLDRVFPEARHVVLLRDPLDVAASMRSTWDLDLPALLAREADDPFVFDLVVGPERLLAFARERPERTRIVRYEDLVREPAQVLGDILQFLDLRSGPDLLDAMLAFGTSSRSADGLGDSKILATDRPHARSVGTWREAFTPTERQSLADGLGREHFETLGYGATFSALLGTGVEDRGGGRAASLRARIAGHLEDRARNHGRLETELSAFRTELSHLRDAFEVVKAEAAALRAERDAARTEAADARAAQQAASAEAAAARAEAATARTETAIASAEAQAARAEIQAIHVSTSWRLTRPLRRISTWLRAP